MREPGLANAKHRRAETLALARRAHVKTTERHETVLAERRRCRAEEVRVSGLGHEEGVSLTLQFARQTLERMPFIRDLGHALDAVDRIISVVPGLDEEVADRSELLAPCRPDEDINVPRGWLSR